MPPDPRRPSGIPRKPNEHSAPQEPRIPIRLVGIYNRRYGRFGSSARLLCVTARSEGGKISWIARLVARPVADRPVARVRLPGRRRRGRRGPLRGGRAARSRRPGFDQLARQDDLVPLPVLVGQVPDGTAGPFQATSDRGVTTAESAAVSGWPVATPRA